MGNSEVTLGKFIKIFAVILISAILVMYLWNWLMPMFFGVTTITYIQALGFKALCGLLFKKFDYDKILKY